MKLGKTFLLCALVILLAACGKTEKKPPTVGETKTFTEVCEKANDGKRVALEGYLRLPEQVNRKVGPVLRLYATTDYSGMPIGVSTDFGTQPNQIAFIPKEYTDKDLKVYVANGQTAGFGTKVKVSGDVYFPLVGQDFQCSLSNSLIEIAK